MTETQVSKTAKVIFIICLILFIFKEKSLYAVNVLRDLIVNNALIFAIFAIILLIWATKNERRK